MSQIIEKFYRDAGIQDSFLKDKLDTFDRHQDVRSEFEHWIRTGNYETSGISVEGYNAKSLSERYRYLKGEGAFLLLIELRENPEKARRRIEKGFKKR